MELKYLNTCACVDEMNNITSRVFVRLSYEYGIVFIKRELIPTMASVCVKSVIAHINKIRDKNDIAAYIDLYGLLTLGLVELNFEETEKATNILPDFRLGERACELAGMNYDKYNSRQVPLNKYKGRILEVSRDKISNTWDDITQQICSAIYSSSGFNLNDSRILNIFFQIFLEEMFYELGKHKGEKDYTYKLFDILYFNTTNDPELWGTDVMPEYKLMVKNDSYQEDNIYAAIEGNEVEEEHKKGLYW